MTIAETPPPPVSPQDARSSAFRFVRDLIVIVLVAVLVSALVKAFVVRAFYIPSASMESTLQINDRILVNELVPAVIPVAHGDVVVFRDPGGWLDSPPPQATGLAGMIDATLTFVGLSASDSENHLIKRVIGLPGDTVVCCTATGELSVNDIPLDEPYTQLPYPDSPATKSAFTVTVPAESLWVMGDNRFDSADSAYHHLEPGAATGFVPLDSVVGRAFVVSWPAQRWAWLDDFPATFAGITPPSPTP